MVENITGRPFAFSMIPCRGQLPYFLEAFSQQQRVIPSSCSSQSKDLWVRVLTVVQLLMQRLCTKRHSKTMTSIHNDVWLQDTLGRGRYGVVRLGQIIVHFFFATISFQKTGEMCAVKLINKKKVDPEVLQHELTVLRSLIVLLLSLVLALNHRIAFARPTSCGSWTSTKIPIWCMS